jgi:hypothetical protein
MIMTEKKSPHPRMSPPPPRAGGPHGPDEDGLQTTKSIMFDGHEDLLRRVLSVKDRTKGSFSRTVLSLLETALAVEEASGRADAIEVGALPPWMRSALFEASKLTGHSPAGVVVDILGKNLREHLENARSQEAEMAKMIQDPKAPKAPPAR